MTPAHSSGARRPRVGWKGAGGLLVGIATVAGTVITGLDRWAPLDGDGRTAPSTTATVLGSSAPSPGAADGPDDVRVSPAAVPPGTCWAASGSQAPCDADHTTETIEPPCTTAGLVAYLGGDPAVDVVDPRLRLIDHHGRCDLTAPGVMRAPVRGLLARPEGDGLRYCLTTAHTPIGCAGRHDAEVVAEGPLGSAMACDARLTEFASAQPGAWAQGVRTEQQRTARSLLCVAVPRGDDVLTASLRHLGTSTLPLESR